MSEQRTWEREREIAEQLARQAGELQLERSTGAMTIEHKGVSDLVTDVDKASEALILNGLLEAFPNDEILAEESGHVELDEASGRMWVVDPLDGTTNYAHRFPLYAVSIALLSSGQPVVGVIYVPPLDEMFIAVAGQGATLNGAPITVSMTSQLSQSLVATGFAYDPEIRPENLPLWRAFIRDAQAVRRVGSAAYDLCCVAAGRFEVYWEREISAWDIAAGALIVQEAGGLATRYSGEELDLFNREILAANPQVHGQASALILETLQSVSTGTAPS